VGGGVGHKIKLTMKVGKAMTAVNASSFQDVMGILTDPEEYNKEDNIRKSLIFEVQYEIWGTEFWMNLERDFCNGEGIELVGGKPGNMGSIAYIMSEKKTWTAQKLQKACGRRLGSYVGKRDCKTGTLKQILKVFTCRETNKKIVVYATKITDTERTDERVIPSFASVAEAILQKKLESLHAQGKSLSRSLFCVSIISFVCRLTLYTATSSILRPYQPT
jgi:hypothetical protein